MTDNLCNDAAVGQCKCRTLDARLLARVHADLLVSAIAHEERGAVAQRWFSGRGGTRRVRRA